MYLREGRRIVYVLVWGSLEHMSYPVGMSLSYGRGLDNPEVTSLQASRNLYRSGDRITECLASVHLSPLLLVSALSGQVVPLVGTSPMSGVHPSYAADWSYGSLLEWYCNHL